MNPSYPPLPGWRNNILHVRLNRNVAISTPFPPFKGPTLFLLALALVIHYYLTR